MNVFTRLRAAATKARQLSSWHRSATLLRLEQIALLREYDRLHERIAKTMPGNPAAAGYKMYSQSDEDGVLAEIAQRLNIACGTFVEIGCGDGRENNTHALLLAGWRGVWIDGNGHHIAAIRRQLPLPSALLAVECARVDRDSVLAVVTRPLEQIARPGEANELDLLSVDIDGNDVAVTLPLALALRPKIIVVEYNAKLRWPLTFEVAYAPDRAWQRDDYHGASLTRWVEALSDHQLVACNVAGINAFFVRVDLAGVFQSYSPAQLEQPARVHMAALRAGHAPTLKFLADHLRRQDGER